MAPGKIVGSSRQGVGTDWLETTVNGGSLLLTLVGDAAAVAPIPYLKQAAGVTLRIAQAVQGVKENKMAFRRLAHQAMELIASIWEAYQRSSNQREWPPQEISVVIQELLQTLQSIFDMVEHQLRRSKAVRLIYSVADLQKINEFREQLQAAINKFETADKVSSHLSIHDTLSLVVKAQIQAQEDRQRDKIAQAERESAELQRLRLAEELRIHEREGARKAQQVADDLLRFLALEKENRERMQEETETQNAILRIHAASDAQTLREQAEIAELQRRRVAEEMGIREREREREQMALQDEENLRRLRLEEQAKMELEQYLKEQAAAESAWRIKAMQDLLDRERAEKEELERGYLRETAQLREELEQASRKESIPTTATVDHKTPESESVLMAAALGRYSLKLTETQTLTPGSAQSGKLPASVKASVESEDDEDDQTAVNPDDDESSSEEDAPLPPPPPIKKKKKTKGKVDKTPDSILRQQLLALGLDPYHIPSPSANSSARPPQTNPNIDALAEAYGRMGINSGQPNSSPYHFPHHSPYASPPPIQSPYSPPMYPSLYGSPGMYGAPHTPPVGYMNSGYSQPGSNSGNVTNTTISNVGNNYSVTTTHAPAVRRKKKTRRS